MIHRSAALCVLLCASCATITSPDLVQGLRRTAFAFEFSDSDTDVEGFGSTEDTEIALEGDFGWVVARQLEVGGSALVSNSESDDGFSTQETTVFGIGPFVRYYFLPDGPAIPFVEGRIAFVDLEFDDGMGTIDGDGFQWDVGVGLLAPLSSWVGVETKISYFNGDFDVEGVDFESDGVSVRVGLAAFF